MNRKQTDTSTQDEGTVAVNNTCQAEGQAINIVGTAAPANPTYGAAGVFQVGFPGQAGPDCPGPNYIVQGTSIPVVFRRRKIECVADFLGLRLHWRLCHCAIKQLHNVVCAEPRA